MARETNALEADGKVVWSWLPVEKRCKKHLKKPLISISYAMSPKKIKARLVSRALFCLLTTLPGLDGLGKPTH
jgi:hypothetical protein